MKRTRRYTERLQVGLSQHQLVALDAWIGRRTKQVSRAEALRQLAFECLPVGPRSGGQFFSGILQEHFAPEIDRFSSATIPDIIALLLKIGIERSL